jgi:hypothetical protein
VRQEAYALSCFLLTLWMSACSSNGRWGCRITDAGLLQISLAKCGPNLTSISLWGVTAITDEGVVQLVKLHPPFHLPPFPGKLSMSSASILLLTISSSVFHCRLYVEFLDCCRVDLNSSSTWSQNLIFDQYFISGREQNLSIAELVVKLDLCLVPVQVTRAVSLEHFNVGGTFITDISILAIASHCKLLKVLQKPSNPLQESLNSCSPIMFSEQFTPCAIVSCRLS